MTRPVDAATRLMPAALVLYLGFLAGGYPPGVASYAAVMLALLLALRALTGNLRRPGGLGIATIAALLALATWQLLSARWSGSPIRAIVDADRTLLYVLVVASIATLERPSLPYVVRRLTAAVVLIAVAALVARLLFGIAPPLSPHRLSWPLTYWNSLGLLLGLGLVLCVHVAADDDGTDRARRAAACVLPAMACALYLTLSRSGLGLGAAGLAAYALLARPPRLLGVTAAVLPGTALVLLYALTHQGLIGAAVPEATVRSQARVLALVIVLAGALTFWLLRRVGPLDAWARSWRPPLPSRRTSLALAGCALVLFAAGASASGVPSKLYDRFTAENTPQDLEPGQRVLQLSNSGRVELWRVALQASRHDRLKGTGADTFGLSWDRLRREARQSTEAHSLYVETLSELGIIGLALLVLVLGLLCAAPLLAGDHRGERALVATVLGMWLLHMAFEWDWEMSAVTVVPLALAAAVSSRDRRLGPRTGTAVVIGAVLLAILPALTALSAVQSAAALRSYDNGDCAAATRQAARARTLLSARPEPWLVTGLCSARRGQVAAAERDAREAVARDPENSEYHYDHALLVTAAGMDPRSEIQAVHRLNARTRQLGLLGLLGTDGRQRRRAALEAPIFVDRRGHAPVEPGR